MKVILFNNFYYINKTTMNNTPAQKFEFPGFVVYSTMGSFNASMATATATSKSQVENDEK